ncbi:hypothetical protein [Bacillus sp. 3255]|uniref:hypothetical protein n=1 Tax=Bacillus sp. 3255 TaxID=2817904 RepID=UPI002858F265|nr:hypothetical protein [Bacillus sp. 3255]MDR6883653.1 hypothetical protein [Bacillus sp. 3255]
MSARTNLQDLEDIVSCLEEVKNIVVARLVPEEARTHFRQAEKEALLGVRSLLDAAIGRLDDEQPRKKERSKQIPVEE